MFYNILQYIQPNIGSTAPPVHFWSFFMIAGRAQILVICILCALKNLNFHVWNNSFGDILSVFLDLIFASMNSTWEERKASRFENQHHAFVNAYLLTKTFSIFYCPFAYTSNLIKLATLSQTIELSIFGSTTHYKPLQWNENFFFEILC